jgi:hypothetical protein
MLTALHGGGASACTITQLEKNTRYDFFLIPFYKSIEGKPSNLKQATTLEDGKCDLLLLNRYNIVRLSYLCNLISAKFATSKYGSRFNEYLGGLSEMAATTNRES